MIEHSLFTGFGGSTLSWVQSATDVREEQSMKLANLEKAYELAPEFKGKMKVGHGCSYTDLIFVDWHQLKWN